MNTTVVNSLPVRGGVSRLMPSACGAGVHCAFCRDRQAGARFRQNLTAAHPRAMNGDGTCAFGVPWGVKKGEAEPRIAAAPAVKRPSTAVAADDWQTRGPLMWAELHGRQSPGAAWLRSFSSRIPCGICGAHWRKLMEDRPPVYEPISAWRRWTVDAHNAVNERLGKPKLSYEQAAARWGWADAAPVDAVGDGSLRDFFDRVVVINLDRRPDRWARVNEAMSRAAWPFRAPMRFSAIDGRAAAIPPAWRQAGPGAYGCMMSHRAVLASAIADGIEKLLVLEDDVCFVAGFAEKVRTFLANVPADWNGLMLGGQHMMAPRPIAPGIVRCMNGQRTHAYAVSNAKALEASEGRDGLLGSAAPCAAGGRFSAAEAAEASEGRDGLLGSEAPCAAGGRFSAAEAARRVLGLQPLAVGGYMRDLHAAWEKFVGHCDHRMGQMQPHYRVFAPSPWLAGQDSGKSDITQKAEGLRWW